MRGEELAIPKRHPWAPIKGRTNAIALGGGGDRICCLRILKRIEDRIRWGILRPIVDVNLPEAFIIGIYNSDGIAVIAGF
jgi:hypothetical protein